MWFYDIESLHNIFTVCLLGVEPVTSRAWLEVYHLIDDDTLRAEFTDADNQARLAETIRSSNPALRELDLDGRYRVHDLHEVAHQVRLARQLAVSDAVNVHTADQHHEYPRVPDGARPEQIPHLRVPAPVCDTSPDYRPTSIEHAICAGYNSYNYDTTMLAVFFAELFSGVGADQRARAMRETTLPDNTTADTGSRVAQTNHTGDAPHLSAAILREHNDRLFSPAFSGDGKNMTSYLYDKGGTNHHPKFHANNWQTLPAVIRNNMIKSGRHIDVARFNEVQQMMGLKRHLGQLGHQILESDKLTGEGARVDSVDDVIELLSYNVSDVMGLKLLFEHPLYSGAFTQRAKLLQSYPACIYEHTGDNKTPDIRPQAVAKRRMTIDSLSAQFVARVLAPYTKLTDIPVVDFRYPHPDVAEELGIEVRNVLDDAREFFHDNITDETARAAFEEVYLYYKSIEGRNYNPDNVELAQEDYVNFRDDPQGYQRRLVELMGPLAPAAEAGDQRDPRLQINELSEVDKRPNNLPYFRADGTPTTGFVTFSVGGIHGAEYFEERFDADTARHQESADKLAYARAFSRDDPRVIREQAPVHIAVTDGEDGSTLSDLRIDYTDVLTSNSTKKNPVWREVPKVKRPVLFTERKDGSTKLADKYYYVSHGDCVHEDFTSYYPLLLTNLRAFYNPDLGEDLYSVIFGDKERYGRLMKDPATTDAERAMYAVLRNGAKLLLNAASGAGDARHDTNIRMSNRIITMRIIGQLFLWRIGQAQTLAGATIISTNTDGLYSAGIDEETNNRVLDEQVEFIHVDIEPEPLTLVSKDANNRVEFDPLSADQAMDPATRRVASAGGSLACHAGPHPSKRLQSAAMTQHLLVEYFKYVTVGHHPVLPGPTATGEPLRATEPVTFADPIDRTLLREILERAHETMDPADLLGLYQTVVASSKGAISHLIAADYQIGEITRTVRGKQVTTHESLPADEAQYLSDERRPRAIGQYNRIFIVDPDKLTAARVCGDTALTPVCLATAKAPIITAATAARRKKDGVPHAQFEPVATRLLQESAVDTGAIMQANKRDITLGKYSGVDPAAPLLIHNHSLRHQPADTPITNDTLLEVIDREAYLDLAVEKYEADWRNTW